MAQRKYKLLRRVDSSEVQGEGSYVVMRALTLPDMQDIEKTVGKDRGGMAPEMVRRATQEWDWVDDDGNPLPLPKDDPDLLNKLPTQELTWLYRAMGVGDEDSKNSS